ncbi:MAG: Lrp/AsnC family transcriptional regulator [Nitrospirota bacterium]
MISFVSAGKDIENLVLKNLQEDVPIVNEPFKVIAQDIETDEEEIITVINDLKGKRIIRQISPIYDTRMLGYDSLLVAFKVRAEALEGAALLVSSHPCVSHNYERGHEFNLWFTIAVPPDSRIGADKTVSLLAEKGGAEGYAVMRSKRSFKIGVKLDAESSCLDREDVVVRRLSITPLTEEEKLIIRVTQADMPVCSRPFSVYAGELCMEEYELIEKLREFKERGVMRRFAAVLNHRKAGFSANGMVVWNVSEGLVDEVGLRIASFKAVSHCYERTTSGVWRYNLFSMMHARTRDELDDVITGIREETGMGDYAVLYSSREFKKKRIQYFTGELHAWEKAFTA